jgi:hypothetical protein
VCYFDRQSNLLEETLTEQKKRCPTPVADDAFVTACCSRYFPTPRRGNFNLVRSPCLAFISINPQQVPPIPQINRSIWRNLLLGLFMLAAAAAAAGRRSQGGGLVAALLRQDSA